MRKLKRNSKWVLVVILFVLVVIFAIQNAATVEIKFLTWTVETRRVGVIAFSLICGGVIGWMFGTTSRQ